MTPQAVIDVFDHLRAVSVDNTEFAGELAAAEPQMPELIVDVVERIVVPVTTVGERTAEPCDESFALDALGSVFVTALRTLATARPDTAEPLARTALHLITRLLVQDDEELADTSWSTSTPSPCTRRSRPTRPPPPDNPLSHLYRQAGRRVRQAPATDTDKESFMETTTMQTTTASEQAAQAVEERERMVRAADYTELVWRYQGTGQEQTELAAFHADGTTLARAVGEFGTLLLTRYLTAVPDEHADCEAGYAMTKLAAVTSRDLMRRCLTGDGAQAAWSAALALFTSLGFWHRSWGAVAEGDGAVRLRGSKPRLLDLKAHLVPSAHD
ncbi:hypothetical protein ACPCSP_34465 [Streptomyces cinereoruber]|uniref:hypothetical protein n=1 Tax=Streptomyces cinereoruber TaxID=67260 RepID=UPI003C2FB7A6